MKQPKPQAHSHIELLALKPDCAQVQQGWALPPALPYDGAPNLNKQLFYQETSHRPQAMLQCWLIVLGPHPQVLAQGHKPERKQPGAHSAPRRVSRQHGQPHSRAQLEQGLDCTSPGLCWGAPGLTLRSRSQPTWRICKISYAVLWQSYIHIRRGTFVSFIPYSPKHIKQNNSKRIHALLLATLPSGIHPHTIVPIGLSSGGRVLPIPYTITSKISVLRAWGFMFSEWILVTGAYWMLSELLFVDLFLGFCELSSSRIIIWSCILIAHPQVSCYMGDNDKEVGANVERSIRDQLTKVMEQDVYGDAQPRYRNDNNVGQFELTCPSETGILPVYESEIKRMEAKTYLTLLLFPGILRMS